MLNLVDMVGHAPTAIWAQSGQLNSCTVITLSQKFPKMCKRRGDVNLNLEFALPDLCNTGYSFHKVLGKH